MALIIDAGPRRDERLAAGRLTARGRRARLAAEDLRGGFVESGRQAGRGQRGRDLPHLVHVAMRLGGRARDARPGVQAAAVEIGQDLLSNMGWPFEELISYASRGTMVRAGDVLGSGTCGNGGCLAELWGRCGEISPPPLQPGDVVEMTVEGIGTIRNRVVPGLDLPPVRPARSRPRSRKRPQ